MGGKRPHGCYNPPAEKHMVNKLRIGWNIEGKVDFLQMYEMYVEAGKNGLGV